ncbi:conserved hypothetical protein [Leishmania major strain Friedlin]|uniref:Uncharacterized protein n=1 Tax=Leishmania major TaxID=5664 RepID=Q4Q625_LEIMA|nr:conserved hypothetical protein [Leishmania major strain Friedlin]CAG9579414.1 hypothetical_protein_-_conserved [Leishmania major strain Friedlin]CAJ08425.1 conserved hypothetical protein [Leishmania major strain Friedlin]|eukprot:XP_001685223.1 conserved hypothetical protein [Leishmania major strain Friedlin]
MHTSTVAMMNKGGDGGEQPTIAVLDRGDCVDLKRESSLLPGEVRTPTMVVTLSEAWGDSSADWAAPGSSSVWEEEAANRPSAQTPLTRYGRSDVWASATGSPLMGDGMAHQHHFGQTEAKGNTDSPDTAELAAAALQALSPQGVLHTDSGEVHVPLPQRQASQPRYSATVHYGYESRFGTVHEAPLNNDLTQFFPRPRQPQSPTKLNYFTVQESSAPPSAALAEPTAMSHGGTRTASPGTDAVFSGGPTGMSYVPRLEDEEVAHRIIVSAGLPLAMHSLVEYIHGGQPRAPAHATALGTTQNALRNYPNLSDPPTEEEALGSRGGTGGAYGSRLQRGGYGQALQGRCVPTLPSLKQDNRFAVRGQDAIRDSPQDQALAPSSNYGGGFMVSAGTGTTALSRVSARTPYSTHGNGVAGRHKSESKYLSDLLHFHANFFPPPPPPRVPKDERRNRAELWYHYTSKWDITHRLPPPPRTPLPEMELEYRMRVPQMTRVPYHGDGWLQMSERWFDVMQALFDFPEDNVGDEVDFNVVLQQAVLS